MFTDWLLTFWLRSYLCNYLIARTRRSQQLLIHLCVDSLTGYSPSVESQSLHSVNPILLMIWSLDLLTKKAEFLLKDWEQREPMRSLGSEEGNTKDWGESSLETSMLAKSRRVSFLCFPVMWLWRIFLDLHMYSQISHLKLVFVCLILVD